MQNSYNDCQCKKLPTQFSDKLPFDFSSKTVVSVRDGVQEYLGSEIGLEPAQRVFTVYRSPATVANIAAAMDNLPMTDNHVTVGGEVANPVGSVVDSQMVDLVDGAVNSTLGIKNGVTLTDAMLGLVESGKRELSLGYNAELVDHDIYDFEQRNIIPHHLAVVDAGRCGAACSFIDKANTEGMNMHKAFLDENGEVNLEQVAEIAMQIPEALKKVPVDKLQEIVAPLQEVVEAAKPSMAAAEPVVDEEETEGEEVTDMPEETTDEDKEKEFADRLQAALKTHGEVIGKATKFVDADYAFAGKTTEQIMRDALATQHDQAFEDAELAVAFKMLKPESKYQQFGDTKPTEAPTSLSARLKSELED